MLKWAASQVVLCGAIETSILSIEKLIAIAQAAYNINDFATCICILEGLSDPGVMRLNFTWKRISTESQKILDNLMPLRVFITCHPENLTNSITKRVCT